MLILGVASYIGGMGCSIDGADPGGTAIYPIRMYNKPLTGSIPRPAPKTKRRKRELCGYDYDIEKHTSGWWTPVDYGMNTLASIQLLT